MSYIDEYTNFIFLEDEPQLSDIIFVPGSEEGVLARYAAKLYKEGYAPIVLPSGKFGKLAGRISENLNFETEWEYFHFILMEEGVPNQSIWREDRATFTYENALFSREVTDKKGLIVKRAILCCQAYHARRAKLYYQVCFPEAEILVCPVVTKGISKENWFLSKRGIHMVLTEMKHCGTQFEEIMAKNISI